MSELNRGFVELNYKEQMEIGGGDGIWPGGDLVYAIFDCGRQLGRAIRHAFGG